MTTAESQVQGQIGDLRGQMGEVRGEVNGINRRVDDLHRLLMVLIAIAGGGLVTAVTSLVLQILKIARPYASQSSNQATRRERYSSRMRGWPVRGKA